MTIHTGNLVALNESFKRRRKLATRARKVEWERIEREIKRGSKRSDRELERLKAKHGELDLMKLFMGEYK